MQIKVKIISQPFTSTSTCQQTLPVWKKRSEQACYLSAVYSCSGPSDKPMTLMPLSATEKLLNCLQVFHHISLRSIPYQA
jgi:hypothetical protein